MGDTRVKPFHVKALFDFSSDDTATVAIKKGDLLTVYRTQEEWMYGVRVNGTAGFFPAVFVELTSSNAHTNVDLGFTYNFIGPNLCRVQLTEEFGLGHIVIKAPNDTANALLQESTLAKVAVKMAKPTQAAPPLPSSNPSSSSSPTSSSSSSTSTTIKSISPSSVSLTAATTTSSSQETTSNNESKQGDLYSRSNLRSASRDPPNKSEPKQEQTSLSTRRDISRSTSQTRSQSKDPYSSTSKQSDSQLRHSAGSSASVRSLSREPSLTRLEHSPSKEPVSSHTASHSSKQPANSHVRSASKEPYLKKADSSLRSSSKDPIGANNKLVDAPKAEPSRSVVSQNSFSSSKEPAVGTNNKPAEVPKVDPSRSLVSQNSFSKMDQSKHSDSTTTSRGRSRDPPHSVQQRTSSKDVSPAAPATAHSTVATSTTATVTSTTASVAAANTSAASIYGTSRLRSSSVPSRPTALQSLTKTAPGPPASTPTTTTTTTTSKSPQSATTTLNSTNKTTATTFVAPTATTTTAPKYYSATLKPTSDANSRPLPPSPLRNLPTTTTTEHKSFTPTAKSSSNLFKNVDNTPQTRPHASSFSKQSSNKLGSNTKFASTSFIGAPIDTTLSSTPAPHSLTKTTVKYASTPTDTTTTTASSPPATTASSTITTTHATPAKAHAVTATTPIATPTVTAAATTPTATVSAAFSPPAIAPRANSAPPVAPPPPAPSTPPRKCTVMHAFHQKDSAYTMLSLEVGDVVNILKEEGDWLEGECKGARGYVPKSFVKEDPLPPNHNHHQPHQRLEEAFESVASPRQNGVMANLDRALLELKLDNPSARVTAAIELVETERRYVEDLQVLQHAILLPLQKSAAELNESKGFVDHLKKKLQGGGELDNVNAIVTQWGAVCSQNAAFLAAMQGCVQHWHSLPEKDHIIGPILLEHLPKFNSYGKYCAQYYSIQSGLTRVLHKQGKFSRVRKNADESGLLQGRTIGSYLISPIQRVPRYQMLLGELLKCTPTEHADYSRLQSALKIVMEVGRTINESVRIQENHELIVKLESTFDTSPLFSAQPRELLRYGELAKVSTKGEGAAVDNTRTFFLFDDMLAYSRVKVGNKLMLRGRLAINSSFEIVDTSPLQITIKSVKNMTLLFKSVDEKTNWFNDLTKIFIQQTTKSRCGYCRSDLPLSSLTKCTTCFALVCASCSRLKTDICCLTCHDFHKAPFAQRKTSVLGLRGSGKKSVLPPSPSQQTKPTTHEQTATESAVAVLDCPQGHGLSLNIALQEGYGCDACGLDMAIGERMQCCVACNYFVCVSCQQRPGVTLKLDSTQMEIDAMIEKAQTGFLDRFIQGVLEDEEEGSTENSPTADGAVTRKFSLKDLRQRMPSLQHRPLPSLPVPQRPLPSTPDASASLSPPVPTSTPPRSLSPSRIFGKSSK